MKSFIFHLALVCLILPISLFSQSFAEAKKLFEAENYEAAKNQFVAIWKNDPSHHQASYFLGRTLIQLKDYDGAIKQLKKSKKALAKDADFHYWYGQAYRHKLQATNNFLEKGVLAPKTKDAFEKAVALNPEHIEARNSLFNYYMSAPAIAGGSTKKAFVQVEEIKRRDPIVGHQVAAQYYQKKKEFAKAEQELLALVDLGKGSAEVYYRIGFMYQSQKMYDKAFVALEQSISFDKNYTSSYYQYARNGVFSKKNLDRSVEMMKYYINHPSEDGPELTMAYWRLGMLYELKGEKMEAKMAYEKALELNMDNERAMKALQKLY